LFLLDGCSFLEGFFAALAPLVDLACWKQVLCQQWMLEEYLRHSNDNHK
jgi:hypothetical protein